MLAYYGTEISPNQTETVEGFLICRNVPIARTGEQEYLARELQLGGDPERIVVVERRPGDVFEPAALASFEGKDVTDGHPPENLSPENFAAYSKGHVENVRRDGDFIVADLYIKDKSLISDIQNGIKREVSCGYLCNYEPDGTKYRQSHIRGNHVAVVPRGRAGHEVAIKDSAAEKAEKGRKSMNEFWKNVLTAFGKAAKDASPEELDEMVTTTATALDAAPAEKAPEAEPVEEAAAEPAGDAAPAEASALDSKLSEIMDMLGKLMPKEEEPADEDGLDEIIEKLGGGKPEEAVTIPAEEMSDGCLPDAGKDTAVELLKRVRPAVAAIQNKEERARVTDALLSVFKGTDVMKNIMQASRESAQKAADSASKTTYEDICRAQKAAYDARNPHKSKEE